jgi:LAO/AO transport system kinase
VEAGEVRAEEVLRLLFAHTGRARVVGVTGPPGAGKSTLVRGLIAAYRSRKLTVGVLAIDPSSPFSKGALLGDRIRMGSHASDDGVFVRSMANRGHLGGLATATPAAVRVLDAMGFDRIIVETVGVGQSEIDVAEATDCTLLVLIPGTGDAVQAMKAGVIEIGDVFAINKSDRDGAAALRQALETVLHLRPDRGVATCVLMTRADRGEGIDALVEAIEGYLEAVAQSGQMQRSRLRRLEREALDLAAGKIRRWLTDAQRAEVTADLMEGLRNRQLDPAMVAQELFAMAVGSSGWTGKPDRAKLQV